MYQVQPWKSSGVFRETWAVLLPCGDREGGSWKRQDEMWVEASKNILGVKVKAGKDLGAEQNEAWGRKWPEGGPGKWIAFNHDVVWSAAGAGTHPVSREPLKALKQGQVCLNLHRLLRPQHGGWTWEPQSHRETSLENSRVIETRDHRAGRSARSRCAHFLEVRGYGGED